MSVMLTGNLKIADRIDNQEEVRKLLQSWSPSSPREQRIVTGNRKYDLRLTDGYGNVRWVVKKFWNNPDYAFFRRVNLMITAIIDDPSRRAFHAAIDLDKIDFPTVKPVAYWRTTGSFWNCTSYFVAEYLEETETLKARLASVLNNSSLSEVERSAERVRLVQCAGRLAARLHAAGFCHRDITVNNFLLPRASTVSQPITDSDQQMWLIDLERVRRLYFWEKLLRPYSVMSCFRRLELQGEMRTIFFREYLQRDIGPIRSFVLEMCASSWHSPLRRLWKKVRKSMKDYFGGAQLFRS